MSLEIALLRKALVTPLATVVLHTCVDLDVRINVAFLRKALAAHLDRVVMVIHLEQPNSSLKTLT